MKHLLVTALLLSLTACNDTSSSSPNINPQTDLNQPYSVWTAPSSISGVEQEFRGIYFNQANHNSSITINSDFSASGSIETTKNAWVNGRMVGENSTVCTFTADHLMISQYPNNPSFYLDMRVLTGLDYSADMPKNCPSMGTPGAGRIEIVAFTSEKCINLRLPTDTGIQTYCKE